jgi:hypothetical protein
MMAQAKAQTATMMPQPTLIPMPTIVHEMPMSPELSAYMEDLPQMVRTPADVERLANKLEMNLRIGLWQTGVVKTIEQIGSEMIYAMVWNAHCITQNWNSKIKNYQDRHGIIFFSNTRFFCYVDPATQVEIPLDDIHTVATHAGKFLDGISFRTQDLDVQGTFPGAVDRKLFRDMVIYIAANAAIYHEQNLNLQSDISIAFKPQICECPGCGATVIIHAEIINKCEYCGRYVEKQGG